MANIVEAHSLSALTALASDPPADPGRHSSDARLPLTLYLARVPGSRDVFLTPLKPRQKVVTAEDIHSSLYYLHVHGPHDKAILEHFASRREEPRFGEEVEDRGNRASKSCRSRENQRSNRVDTDMTDLNRNGIASSRPLPSVPVNESSSEPKPQLPARPALPIINRKPIGNVQPSLSVRTIAASHFNMQASVISDAQETSSARYSHFDSQTENLQPFSMPPYPLSPIERAQKRDKLLRELPPLGPPMEVDKGSCARRLQGAPPLPTRRRSKPALSRRSTQDEEVIITLIRRNPSSGEQWNVAKITDPPVFDVTSETRRNSFSSQRARRKGQPIYLEIMNPGYNKFIQSSGSQPSTRTPSESSSMQEDVVDEGVFSRRLWMEGSRFERNTKHQKSLSADMSNFSSSRSNFDSRQSSEISISRGLSPDPVMHSISVDINKPRSKIKDYTFMSPWNGRCEFSPGVGQTLKCRHSMANQYLALITEPVVVSELRFNLPGGGPVPSPPKGDRDRDSYSSSRRSRLLGRRKMSEDQVYPAGDESERLDLSLGQERAGGGFGGKQAKLGKLIIEVEGLKMLDLLVAANMSLWWRAYEKG